MAAKLKVLMLHGYRQNAAAFRAKTGAFRKLIKKHCEITFVDAPFPLEADSEELGWFFCSTEPTRHYQSTEETDSYEGLDDTLKLLNQTFEEEGGFDGVIAFSQGAQLLSIICAMKQTQNQDLACLNFKFAVFVSGFKSYAADHSSLYNEPCTLPSLHIMGTTDEVIPLPLCEALAAGFSDKTTIVHEGGHFVPAPKSGTEQRQTLDEFFTKCKTLNE